VLSTTWALLEPDGMKANLRRWLVQNLRNGAWIDLRQSKGFDAKQYDRMYGYAFNACLFFKTVDTYLRTTGDKAFLDERLEDGHTVFAHMERIATDWQTLPKGPDGLVDCGGNECLLECAPNYTHCVASVNAKCVWLLRQMAKWHDLRGNPARASELRGQAAAFLPKVMGLYKPGEGVWSAYHMDGKKVELRHCMDYVFAGDALKDDLNAGQKAEMNAFVQRELFMRDWMRAMSLKDESAAVTNRTDHGPYGSYDVWLPLTIGTMWRLGDPQAAFAFYRRAAVATREGSFTQAHEFYGPTRDAFDAPVRISSDRGNMRESCGGGAFTDVVIETFFGFAPSCDGREILSDPATPRPFEGELQHLHFQGKTIRLTAGKAGVRSDSENGRNFTNVPATTATPVIESH
jgi:hypothetical protein